MTLNGQIKDEVKDLLARYDTAQQKFDLKLDIMNSECAFWPTRVTCPGPVSQIGDLQADLRIFDFMYGGAGNFWGEGGPGLIFLPLFQLLNGFFHRGP